MNDLIISFYDCCTAWTGACVSVSDAGVCASFRIDDEHLREAAGLVLSVGALVRRTICKAAKRGMQWLRGTFRAGRSLIRMVCILRF